MKFEYQTMWGFCNFLVFLGSFCAICGTFGLNYFRDKITTENKPNISVRCFLTQNNDPSIIKCEVKNSGKNEAKEVFVGFNQLLPFNTVLFSKPEDGLALIESDSLPDPNLSPHSSLLTKAFAIKIPRVAASETLTFEIKTIDEDNQRTAKQTIKLQKEIEDIIRKFEEKLHFVKSSDAKIFDKTNIISHLKKKNNFFMPGSFSYEKGRFPVEFFSEDELRADAINADLYAKYKSTFIDIYKNRGDFKAPVVKIKSSNGGSSTYAIMPPYITTFVNLTPIKIPETKEEINQQEPAKPEIPSDYDEQKQATEK